MLTAWQPPLSWQTALSQYAAGPCILVSIIDTRGSTPREIGARMLVTQTQLYGSIGGGHLEAYCISHAREICMHQLCGYTEVTQLTLAASLAQCCGGVVTLLFEYIDKEQRWLHPENAPFCSVYDAQANRLIAKPIAVTSQQNFPLIWDKTQNLLIENALALRPLIVVAGAGHVATHLYQYLQPLPIDVRLLDERETINGSYHGWDVVADLPHALATLPAHALIVIATHHHDLDLSCCLSVLPHAFPYIGLIGSYSKYLRFCQQLLRRKIPLSALDRLVCPIGLRLTTSTQKTTPSSPIAEKHPARIALLTVMELLQVIDGSSLEAIQHHKFRYTTNVAHAYSIHQ